VAELDVVIVGRGGGSIEDLWAFNDERVARAIAACPVPVISAVGHETDFTIADFVADLRAPTPSAAAERVVEAKADLQARLVALRKQVDSALDLKLARVRARVGALTSHRVFVAEQGRLRGYAQRVDELWRRADAALPLRVERVRLRALRAGERLEAFRFDRQVAERRARLAEHGERLRARFRQRQEARRARLAQSAGRLDSLSPLAVLGRGYALVFERGGKLVREPSDVAVGDALRIRVHGGGLAATVTSKEPAGERR
jgi:exodeoxyribonuclease VII large subunit